MLFEQLLLQLLNQLTDTKTLSLNMLFVVVGAWCWAFLKYRQAFNHYFKFKLQTLLTILIMSIYIYIYISTVSRKRPNIKALSLAWWLVAGWQFAFVAYFSGREQVEIFNIDLDSVSSGQYKITGIVSCSAKYHLNVQYNSALSNIVHYSVGYLYSPVSVSYIMPQ